MDGWIEGGLKDGGSRTVCWRLLQEATEITERRGLGEEERIKGRHYAGNPLSPQSSVDRQKSTINPQLSNSPPTPPQAAVHPSSSIHHLRSSILDPPSSPRLHGPMVPLELAS